MGLAVQLGAKRVQGGERTGQSLAMSWPLDHNGVSANSRENCDEHFVLWSSVKTAEGRKQLSIRETLQQILTAEKGRIFSTFVSDSGSYQHLKVEKNYQEAKSPEQKARKTEIRSADMLLRFMLRAMIP